MSDQDPETQPHLIRVLVANLSSSVFERLVALAAQQPDIVLVGQVQGKIELLMAAGSQIDILILGASRAYPPPGICTHLLSEYPDLRILVLANMGETAMLYWLGLRRQQLRALTAATLLSGIRRAYSLNPLT